MGELEFSTMKAMVQLRMGQRDELESVSSVDFYGVWVNQAYMQICTESHILGLPRKCLFPELETSGNKTTAAGVAYVAVPDDCLVIRSIYDSTNKVKLNWIPWDEYVSRTDRADTSARGTSTKWTRRGENVYLYSTPDGAHVLNIYHKYIPPALSGNTDVTVLNRAWDEPIVSLATLKGHQYLGEYDAAKIILDEVTKRVIGLVTIYDSEESDRNEYIRPDPSYWSRHMRQR